MEPMLRYLITTFVSESPQVRPAAIQVLNIGTSATEGSAIATEQTKNNGQGWTIRVKQPWNETLV